MRSQYNEDQSWDATGRIRSLDMFTGSLVAAPQGEHPVRAAVSVRGPQPRRSRVFLRSIGDGGDFAELTVTAPQPRRPLD